MHIGMKWVVAVVFLVSMSEAQAQQTSVMGKGATGYPTPIGASGDRLKTEARIVAPDGGAPEVVVKNPGTRTDAGEAIVAPAPGAVFPTAPTAPEQLRAPDGGVVPAAGSALGSTMVAPESGATFPTTPSLVSPSGAAVTQKANAAGHAKTVTDYAFNTRGCVEVVCNATGTGDAGGAIQGVIPVDGGTYYPQAGTRYKLTVSTNSAVRISNGEACTSFQSGPGAIVNEGAILDVVTPMTPDGGVGDLQLHCCAQTAGTLVQLCPL